MTHIRSNCVSWDAAVTFCRWAGGRLPSEAEWEYAARSKGQAVDYPWGNDQPTCNHAVLANDCGVVFPAPVCSKEQGNTAQGACDMAGNVWEWVEDSWHASYDGAPTDGSGWSGGATRIARGGGYQSVARQGRAAFRGVHFGSVYNNTFLGIRCVR